MMKLRPYLILMCLLGFFYNARAQKLSYDVRSALEDLFNRISNTRDDNDRQQLNDSVQLLIDSYVISDSVMTSSFKHLRYPGQITSSDSRIKIITWNLVLRDGTNKYFLYIIRKGEKGNSNRVYKLTGQNRRVPPEPDKIYTEKDWYGALYYAVQPFKTDLGTSYILLGLDFGDPFTSRKIIDVLSFNNNGDLEFGKDCFLRGDKLKAREVIEYSAEGVITLRIESKKEIVFDHIVPFSSGHETAEDNLGSGLTFDGYILKKGIWRFISNIDVKNRKH